MSEESRNSSILIDAEVEREFDPDIFVLTVHFYGECDDRKACVEAYNEDLANVTEALVGAGIQKDAIKNSEFRTEVHFEWIYEKVDNDRDYYRRVDRDVKGYEYRGDCTVSHAVDSDLLKRIFHSLQELDGGFSFTVNFDLERPGECEEELLKEAVRTAQSRAETLVSAAGAELGMVKSIHHRFDNASLARCADVACDSSSVGGDAWAMPLSTPDFNPETIEVRCSISISWAIV